jgi:hypothetical protein
MWAADHRRGASPSDAMRAFRRLPALPARVALVARVAARGRIRQGPPARQTRPHSLTVFRQRAGPCREAGGERGLVVPCSRPWARRMPLCTARGSPCSLDQEPCDAGRAGPSGANGVGRHRRSLRIPSWGVSTTHSPAPARPISRPISRPVRSPRALTSCAMVSALTDRPRFSRIMACPYRHPVAALHRAAVLSP